MTKNELNEYFWLNHEITRQKGRLARLEEKLKYSGEIVGDSTNNYSTGKARPIKIQGIAGGGVELPLMIVTLKREMVKEYERHLWLAERSSGTIQKYLHNIEQFRRYLPREKTVTKETVIAYKKSIAEKYAISTANAALVALNGLFSFLGWRDCRVKPFKQQRCIFRDKERELSEKEYLSLLKAAKQKGNQRLFYIMETLCNTGIRISELQFITAEAVWTGTAVVKCKGKHRKVLLPQRLRKELQRYCKKNRIASGAVFITKTGKPISRTNVWGEMKRLCKAACVDAKKVFPHNFRHLFAVSFYHLEKDIAKLADLLGHASIETTRIYVMETAESHIRQIERMRLCI